jgi:ribonuclease BN (tRNA processing enzyme)
MKLTIWGCRGSIPSPGYEKNIYGGNTSCLQIEHNQSCIILDAGSGIQRLGSHLSGDVLEFNILLTHLHLDHIMGLGFFRPLYNPKAIVNIWGPSGTTESLKKRLRRYFSPPLFPIRLNEIPAQIRIQEIGNTEFQIDDFVIQSEYICHPGPTVGYRVTSGKSTIAYIPDHEPALGASNFPLIPEWTSGFAIAKNADILFHDAQYFQDEYKNRIGWGHSSMEDAMRFGELAKVKKLVFFHHDPEHTDEQVDNLYNESKRKITSNIEFVLGKENAVYELP